MQLVSGSCSRCFGSANRNALERFDVKSFACAGGVSLNRVLREKLTILSKDKQLPLLLSPPNFVQIMPMIAGVHTSRYVEMKRSMTRLM